MSRKPSFLSDLPVLMVAVQIRYSLITMALEPFYFLNTKAERMAYCSDSLVSSYVQYGVQYKRHLKVP